MNDDVVIVGWGFVCVVLEVERCVVVECDLVGVVVYLDDVGICWRGFVE